MNKKILIQFLFFFLSFYCFGGGMMDSFVVYNGWKLVGAAEFSMLHTANGNRIIGVLVLPTLLMTVMTVMMLWNHPFNISKKWIWAAFICEMVSWISSIIIQIPIQAALNEGKNDAMLQRLIVTDWIRVVAWVAYIIIVSKMLITVLRNNAAQELEVGSKR